jgi:MoxR-like ATPase
MKTASFNMTNSQYAFIVAVRPHLAAFGITAKTSCNGQSVQFSPLFRAAHKAGYSAVPAWCMSADRKCGRGVYALPELFADDSAFTITEVKRGRPAGSKNGAKPVKSAKPKTVAAVEPKTVAAPAAQVEECSAVALTAGVDTDTVSLARQVTQGEADSFIPSTDSNYVAWGYHSEIKDIVKKGIFAPVFITGLSGNGKTTMVEQVCASLKRECIRVNFTAQTDEDELIGGFRLINGETKFVPGPVLVAMERGAILLLDEIDLGGHLIMCLQSVLEGKGKYIPKIGKYVRPAKGFNVFATANTKGKGDNEGRFVGTNMMNEAFLERFDFTYEQDYASNAVEKKILAKYAESLGVDEDAFIDNLVSWADIIRKSFKQQVVSEIITTRRLLHIIKAFSIFGDKMKSIERCVARFDEDTKESFLQFYTKVDADAQPKPQVQDAPTAKSNDPNACPF